MSNSLQNEKNLALTKMKAFADNSVNVTKIMIYVFDIQVHT